MKQVELLVQLLDQAIDGIERGTVEDLLEAQYAIYGLAQGACPIRSNADRSVALLCEYCLDCLCYGRREEEWAAVRVLTTMRDGFINAMHRGLEARDVEELVDLVV